MPSPLGHALGGLIVGLAILPDTGGRAERLPSAPMPGMVAARPEVWQVLAVVGAAVAPDLDFLWGRHNMETHSLGAALMAGGLALALTKGRLARLALAVTLAWASHVLLDWLGSDNVAPLGVMALWPFSTTFYFADAFVFQAIKRDGALADLWAPNLWAVTREILLLGPLAAAVWLVRRPGR
jgi:membrane-bound metal-dependent hydrolase YbcI (DUF457 family)